MLHKNHNCVYPSSKVFIFIFLIIKTTCHYLGFYNQRVKSEIVKNVYDVANKNLCQLRLPSSISSPAFYHHIIHKFINMMISYPLIIIISYSYILNLSSHHHHHHHLRLVIKISIIIIFKNIKKLIPILYLKINVVVVILII